MDKKIFNTGVRNIVYALGAQSIVLIIGFFKSLILPSNMTVASFGYWQVYLFYISYVGFFFFGYNDAILLKYNKTDLEFLPEKEIRTGNCIHLLVLFLFSIIVMVFSLFINSDKSLILKIFSFSIPVWGLFGVLIYLYLATNNVKKYSFFNILDQVLFLFFIVISFLFKKFDYTYFICMMFLSKLITVIFMTFDLKKFIFGPLYNFKQGILYYIDNVKIGIFVMLSLILSVMMSNFGKIIIDLQGNIENFASFSFGLSLSSLIIIFVSAIGTVLFPIISRMNVSMRSFVYQNMMEIIKILNCIGLVIYFVLIVIINRFFPQYSSLNSYLVFLFLAVIIQNKVSLIYNTYYKVLRQEKCMLIIYFISIGIPFICAFVLNLFFSSIAMISAFTLFAVVILDNYSNYFFSKKLLIPWKFVEEYIVYSVFFVCANLHNFGGYLFSFFVLLLVFKKRKSIIQIISNLRK